HRGARTGPHPGAGAGRGGVPGQAVRAREPRIARAQVPQDPVSGPSKGLSEFVAEATEIVDTLSSDLLALDEQRGGEVDPERLNGIFRAAHSLKGLSGMFAQDRIAQLAHRAEDLLDRLRLGKVPLNDPVLDGLIASLD